MGSLSYTLSWDTLFLCMCVLLKQNLTQIEWTTDYWMGSVLYGWFHVVLQTLGNPIFKHCKKPSVQNTKINPKFLSKFCNSKFVSLPHKRKLFLSLQMRELKKCSDKNGSISLVGQKKSVSKQWYFVAIIF